MLTETQLKTKIRILEQKLITNKKYLKTEDSNDFYETLSLYKLLIDQGKYKNLNDIENQLKAVEEDINKKLAPKTVCENDQLYNLPIKRICYRGTDQPPTTSDKNAIFQVGFTKQKITNKKYEYKLIKLLKMYGPQNKLTAPLISNLATTIAVSKQFESAALFPNPFSVSKLKTADILDLVQMKLQSMNIDIDFKSIELELARQYRAAIPNETEENYDEFARAIVLSILTKKLSVIKPDQKIELPLLLDETENTLLKNIPKTDHVWIYVVYVDKGYDVHSRGYLSAVNNQFKNQEQLLLFASEICTDNIFPQHIFAAIQIERNFEKLNTDFTGEATFQIKNLVFNEDALEALNKKGINTEKQRKLLQHYMEQNKKNNGTKINLRESGFRVQDKNIIKPS